MHGSWYEILVWIFPPVTYKSKFYSSTSANNYALGFIMHLTVDPTVLKKSNMKNPRRTEINTGFLEFTCLFLKVTASLWFLVVSYMWWIMERIIETTKLVKFQLKIIKDSYEQSNFRKESSRWSGRVEWYHKIFQKFKRKMLLRTCYFPFPK